MFVSDSKYKISAKSRNLSVAKRDFGRWPPKKGWPLNIIGSTVRLTLKKGSVLFDVSLAFPAHLVSLYVRFHLLLVLGGSCHD